MGFWKVLIKELALSGAEQGPACLTGVSDVCGLLFLSVTGSSSGWPGV